MTGGFPSQRASNAENASIWLCHHGQRWWWFTDFPQFWVHPSTVLIELFVFWGWLLSNLIRWNTIFSHPNRWIFMRLRRQWIWFSHLKHQKLVVSSYFRLIANLHSCQNWPRNYLWGNATILLFLFYMIKESRKLPGLLFIQQHLGFKSIPGTFSCRRCQTQAWNAYWPSLKIKSSQFCTKSSSCFLYGCHGNGRYTKWVDDHFPL